MLPPIKQQLSDIPCELTDEINEEFDELKDIYELLLSSIEDEPPISQRDGDIIKAGYNEEVDRLRDAKTKSKTWQHITLRSSVKQSWEKFHARNTTT